MSTVILNQPLCFLLHKLNRFQLRTRHLVLQINHSQWSLLPMATENLWTKTWKVEMDQVEMDRKCRAIIRHNLRIQTDNCKISFQCISLRHIRLHNLTSLLAEQVYFLKWETEKSSLVSPATPNSSCKMGKHFRCKFHKTRTQLKIVTKTFKKSIKKKYTIKTFKVNSLFRTTTRIPGVLLKYQNRHFKSTRVWIIKAFRIFRRRA